MAVLSVFFRFFRHQHNTPVFQPLPRTPPGNASLTGKKAGKIPAFLSKA